MPEENKIKLEQAVAPGIYNSQFLNPRQIIAQLEIRPGMKVAHFGCGTGYFTFPLAALVGEHGTVWALDILEHKIDLIRGNAKTLGLRNVVVNRVNLEKTNGSGLEDESVDWVVMVNMLYQNEKRNRIIGEARRVLKEKGRILLIDWKAAEGTVGPEMHTRIEREELIKSIRKNGLGIARELEIGKLYFGMILTK